MKNSLLSEAREEKGWTQQDLADQLGVTKLTVGRWERGIAFPHRGFRRELSKIFGKSEQELGLVPSAAASPVSTDLSPDLTLNDPAIPLQPAIQLVGRDGAIERIKQRLCTGRSVALTALNGLPGVGKTALAIALAHDPTIRDHFRDGILWAGLGPNPNLPGLLSRWGGLLGISQAEMAAHHDTDSLARVIHHAIGARTMLLVIDDVWKLEEALTFQVGGPNCAYLLTSRNRDVAAHVAIDGATELSELSPEESMILLRMLAPGVVEREAQQAQALIRAVGGLPLALTLMGNYLRKQAHSGQRRRIAAALERLSNAEERLQISEPRGPAETHPSLPGDIPLSLHSVIAVTDQLLSPETRAALYALSVFPPKPNSFSEEAALAVIDDDVENLDQLIDASLLESSSEDRYTIHQTIFDYAQMHVEGTAAQERLIQYVILFVEEHQKEYDLLDQESHIILGALDVAYALKMKEAQIRIMVAFAPRLLQRGEYLLTEPYLKRAYEAATEEQDIMRLLLQLGEAAERQGQWGDAQTYYQEGITLAEQNEEDTLCAAFLIHMGSLVWLQGNYPLAVTSLERALHLARQLLAQNFIIQALAGLGMLARRRGNYLQSIHYEQEALLLARQIGDQEAECRLLNHLGINAERLGDPAQAEVHYREGIALARELGLRDQLFVNLNNLGQYLVTYQHYSQAEEIFQEALWIAGQLGNPEDLCGVKGQYANLLGKLHKYREAEILFAEALTLAAQFEMNWYYAAISYDLGVMRLDQQQVQGAEEAFLGMVERVPEGDHELLAQALYGRARVSARRGDVQDALEKGRHALELLPEEDVYLGGEIRSFLAPLDANDALEEKDH